MDASLHAPRAGVVGGGMMGLAVARELTGRGWQVQLFDGAADLGGLTASVDYGPFTWDRFYHCVLQTDTALLDLLDVIGLGAALRWERTTSGFYHQGRTYSLGSVAEFLRFAPLRFHDRLRLGAFIAACGRVFDGDALEQVSCRDFLRRWCGERVWNVVWRPLLRAKLGPAADSISARFIWDTINRLNSARSGIRKQESIGYVAGGYGRVLDALGDHLRRRGVGLHTNAHVHAVRGEARGGATLVTEDGPVDFDHVFVTANNHAAARMLEAEGEFAARLGGVEFMGVVVGGAVLRRALSPHYILNVSDPSIELTGLIGTSNLVRDGSFAPYHLYYLPRYLVQADPDWQRDEAAWRAFFMDQLQKLAPDLDPADVVSLQVSSARHVQPVLDCGYRERMPGLATPRPNVWLVNTSQCFQGPVNVDLVLRHARNALDELAPRLSLPAPALTT